MNTETDMRIAILYPGNEEVRRSATPDNNRFAPLFHALAELGVRAEPAVYHPDFWQEVYQQLTQVDGVLVWVNPIQDGHDRTRLDALLRQIADMGIFVSAHPDIILKMGTKEVLFETRHMEWGGDIYLYHNLEELRRQFPLRLAGGAARVLKQNRGHSGMGVWKIEAVQTPQPNSTDTLVKVRHADRGSEDEIIPLDIFLKRCEPYFEASGKMIDQAYQARLPEGMIRCYLVQNQVAGFGHQAVNALYPTGEDGAAVQPGVRLYYPPDKPEFQALKRKLEDKWLAELQELLDVPNEHLPVLWDADFMFGAKDAAGEDTYVLCEINVSSVAPYPDSATSVLAQAALTCTRIAKEGR